MLIDALAVSADQVERIIRRNSVSKATLSAKMMPGDMMWLSSVLWFQWTRLTGQRSRSIINP